MHNPEKLKSVTFVCSCGKRFSKEPDRIEDHPEDATHPWLYWAMCPKCGDEAAQAQWERNLMKAHLKSTGPKTPEGKAKSAANLKGHPTPEETARTRFNAMKHGIYARTAEYFPAKPGKYPQCEGCNHLFNCYPGEPCKKRTELFMRTHIAVNSGDPELLGELNADMQAGIFALMQDMLISIVGTGVEIHQPVWHSDKYGITHWVKFKDEHGEEHQVYEINAHPLLKPLTDLLNKNNMTLGDMNLTQKQQVEDEASLGHLESENASAEKLLEYQEQQAEALKQIAGMVQRGGDALENDAILGEYREIE